MKARNNPYYSGITTSPTFTHDECEDLKELSRFNQRSDEGCSRGAPIDNELGSWFMDRSTSR